MNKKSLILSILMVSLVALFGGWWLVFRGQRNVENAPKEPLVASQQLVQTVEKPTKPPEIQDSGIAVDTSNWKTYQNKRYGFEIKYPDGWSFEEKEDSGFFDNSTVFRYVKFIHPGGDEYISFGFKKETETSVVPRSYLKNNSSIKSSYMPIEQMKENGLRSTRIS